MGFNPSVPTTPEDRMQTTRSTQPLETPAQGMK